ncbi:hypothetical protein PGT21_007675 [Puccinia graminis f. sp. tritici]|uniref:Uncharacterized protein n=1 Tax=Puccinia graminis f. sp. tritici TaxID=56615 RepID=A0A5B0PFN2_PUCGR|nr:hypothetical protein PGT21_007918 [Puccinia graminis f. sp. tritici]KAA1117444.1 hypothetical protein PGT21_007675 [Puccinia graminis f. sp. tritici]KAA1120514.1 hypothetical protein PGTUg99_010148 [Puccinia graminis f. sp. tritici]KAA1123251.1 hypothetical protein PGTUg99_016081 [Puccinia graminis f. sp. tritici]
MNLHLKKSPRPTYIPLPQQGSHVSVVVHTQLENRNGVVKRSKSLGLRRVSRDSLPKSRSLAGTPTTPTRKLAKMQNAIFEVLKEREPATVIHPKPLQSRFQACLSSLVATLDACADTGVCKYANRFTVINPCILNELPRILAQTHARVLRGLHPSAVAWADPFVGSFMYSLEAQSSNLVQQQCRPSSARRRHTYPGTICTRSNVIPVICHWRSATDDRNTSSNK